jgi:hypothetical protein
LKIIFTDVFFYMVTCESNLMLNYFFFVYINIVVRSMDWWTELYFAVDRVESYFAFTICSSKTVEELTEICSFAHSLASRNSGSTASHGWSFEQTGSKLVVADYYLFYLYWKLLNWLLLRSTCKVRLNKLTLLLLF